MLSVRSGLVVVGCVFVGFVTSAGPSLVARAAEPPRWGARTLAANDSAMLASGGDAQRRIAQLEQRLKELEAERRGATPAGVSGKASGELAAVIAQNRELTAQNRALAAQNQALALNPPFEPPATDTACEPPPSGADPTVQIRYWAERLRDGDPGFRGRLTTAQNAAVQVLLRPERELDPQNPWRESGPEALASAK
jgi:hypothetical protein